MAQMLQSGTQTTALYKVRAHINIEGNEQADTLANWGCQLNIRNAKAPHEHAHSTSYYL